MLTANDLQDFPTGTELRMTRRGKTISVFLQRSIVSGKVAALPADGAWVRMHGPNGAPIKAQFSELSWP